ncbi:hypothetical protein DSO57_1011937 [Entomophthora muscae]|uniref:Uncharacterized protein n=1 Tax=Entomophthora muscae TaxID=34485 RepID=A0ACC2U4I7_9FUNG|nr:hypothetical protein DSO57_1011937 [Entomophthora muscae]
MKINPDLEAPLDNSKLIVFVPAPPPESLEFSGYLEYVAPIFQVCGLYLGSYSTPSAIYLPRIMDAPVFFCPFNGKNPSKLLYLLDNLPGKAQYLVSTEELLVKSLTSDNLDDLFTQFVPGYISSEVALTPATRIVKEESLIFGPPPAQVLAPGYTPCMLSGMLFIDLIPNFPKFPPQLLCGHLLEWPSQ